MATQGSCNALNGSEEGEDDDESRTEEVRGESSDGEVADYNHARDTKPRMVDELEDFRRQWKCEIRGQNVSSKFHISAMKREGRPALGKDDPLGSNENANNNNKNGRESADELRKALSDLKVDKQSRNGQKNENDDDEDVEEAESRSEDDDDEDDEDVEEGEDDETADKVQAADLRLDGSETGEKFFRVASDNIICRPEFRQGATHISDLPLEVLNLIFKWVVSSCLDVGSLESLSMVCKSFYLLARDEDLWKAICMRTWEKSSLPSCYSSYRQMFLERPHVMFNGCYISRVTYFRQGEKSFDGFYRPFHMVKYYRYIRFYPEGKVYMFMSPEQPKKAVYYLRSRSNYVQGLQYGYYKLSDEKVSLVLKKIPEPSVKSKRFAKNSCHYADHEQTFFMEMSLKTTKQRRNGQLLWLKYFMHRVNKSSGESTTMTFDISADMYPPFHFHPVKSFAAQSELPL